MANHDESMPPADFNPPSEVAEAARKAFRYRPPSAKHSDHEHPDRPPRLTEDQAVAALRSTGIGQTAMERIS
ncbi:MAG TPA: hypothetical protein VK963_04110, partial [Candidatus Saccharimonadales bacterium]|nr:hypothetical protein [Candidatus Saccharimonadales bacterium]